jgi:hypothetical protein
MGATCETCATECQFVARHDTLLLSRRENAVEEDGLLRGRGGGNKVSVPMLAEIGGILLLTILWITFVGRYRQSKHFPAIRSGLCAGTLDSENNADIRHNIKIRGFRQP